jgi:hypothetical protein
MLNLLKKLFGAKPAPAPEAPYKVETPAAAPEVTPVAEQATQAVVESIAPAPAKKKPAAPKKPAGEKKPAAPKKEGAPKKGGRKPKAQQS